MNPPAAPELELFGSATGKSAIGFRRRDLPIVHVIMLAEPGTKFRVDDHFASCDVCKAHAITHDIFHAWYMSRLS